MSDASGAPFPMRGQAESQAALAVDDLHVSYGQSSVLRGLSLMAGRGQVTVVLGRNGVGKSTFVNAVMGVLPAQRGTVVAFGEDLSRAPAWRRARHGLALVPQGRRIFKSLSVREHLTLTGPETTGYPLERLIELFPRLGGRLKQTAGVLSGGEQQMLAIARALRNDPRILLLDEPSEGLAPMIVENLKDIMRSLRREGLTMLLVEQSIPLAMGVADEVRVMARGEVVWRGTRDQFQAAPQVQHAHLGV